MKIAKNQSVVNRLWEVFNYGLLCLETASTFVLVNNLQAYSSDLQKFGQRFMV